MGKISSDQLQKMVDAGKIDPELAETWKKDGIVSVSKRETAKCVKSKNGNLVRPELVFSGLNKDGYSKDMTKLKDAFYKIVDKYCKTEEEHKENQ